MSPSHAYVPVFSSCKHRVRECLAIVLLTSSSRSKAGACADEGDYGRRLRARRWLRTRHALRRRDAPMPRQEAVRQCRSRDERSRAWDERAPCPKGRALTRRVSEASEADVRVVRSLVRNGPTPTTCTNDEPTAGQSASRSKIALVPNSQFGCSKG